MRIIAGILILVCGFPAIANAQSLVEIFGDNTAILLVLITFVEIALIWGGSICAIRKKAYVWALSGAICSIIVAFVFLITSLATYPFSLTSVFSVIGASLLGIIFIVIALLALIFLILRRRQFQK